MTLGARTSTARHSTFPEPSPMTRILAVCAVLASSACTVLPETGGSARADTTRVPLFDNLGSLHVAITTKDSMAQRYFDQGLRLTYAFNHEEAINSFTEATRRDSTCAMCWWGIALAHGPNINAPMESTSVK